MQISQREKALRAFLSPRPDGWFYAAAALLALTLVFMLWLVPKQLGILYVVLLVVSIRVLARTVTDAVRFRRARKALARSGDAEKLLDEFDAAEPEADGALRFGAEHLFVRAGGMPPRYDGIARVFRTGRQNRRRPLRAQLRDGRTVMLVRPTADADGDALAARLTERLLQRAPGIGTHPAEQPPIFEAKEFDV